MQRLGLMRLRVTLALGLCFLCQCAWSAQVPATIGSNWTPVTESVRSSDAGGTGDRASRAGRAMWMAPSRIFVSRALQCASQLDGACLLDVAEDEVNKKQYNLIEEADQYAIQHASRQTSGENEATPSALIESISHMFLELRDIFRGGFVGLFRDGKEDDGDEDEHALQSDKGDDDDEDGAEEDDDADVDSDKKSKKSSRGMVAEERGKKKKKKLKAIIKLLVLGAVFFAKVTLLLKVLAAHLQIKFLLIAFAGLIINAARFYFDLKKGHSPQKVIYYEHAQHQHHYDGGEEDWSGGGGHGGGGGYWGRSYLEGKADEEKSAQDLAYAAHKPVGTTYARVDQKPNFSWE